MAFNLTTNLANQRSRSTLLDLAHCKPKLATFKIPIKFHYLEVMPKTPTGKIQRRMVRAFVQDQVKAGKGGVGGVAEAEEEVELRDEEVGEDHEAFFDGKKQSARRQESKLPDSSASSESAMQQAIQVVMEKFKKYWCARPSTYHHVRRSASM